MLLHIVMQCHEHLVQMSFGSQCVNCGASILVLVKQAGIYSSFLGHVHMSGTTLGLKTQASKREVDFYLYSS